jgi:translation elongation factor EF-Ts
MQIAALNPVAVDAASVSADVIAREKAIIVDLMKQDRRWQANQMKCWLKSLKVKWELSSKNKL